ncbi:MAG: ABC transporter substrate-binding protein [Acidimicrobiales bacterium]|nr:ABC transporter substrate-binding protein [Acidimicrobiales bacterium]
MSSPRRGVRTWSRSHRPRVPAVLVAVTLVACGGGGATGTGDDAGRVPPRGIDGDTITVGAITATSGPMADAGRAVTAGNQAYFAALDEAGGVAGRYHVEVEVLDGADDAATIGRRYDESHDDVAMYVQVLGLHAAEAVLEPLAADDVLAATYALDFPWSRHQNLLALGTPVTVSVDNALDWHARAPGAAGPVCTLVGDGDLGAAVTSAVQASAALHDLDLGPVVEVVADGDAATAGAAVDELARAACDVVVAAPPPAAGTAALARAAATGVATDWFVVGPGRPALDDPAVAAYAADHVRVVTDGSTWPAGEGTGDDGVTEAGAALVAARDAHAPEIADGDPWFLLGYLQAMATHQVLERAVVRGDLSQPGLLAAANTVGELDFGGLAAPYPFGVPELREPPRTTVLVRPGSTADDAEVTVGDDLPERGDTPFEREMQGLPPR